MNYDKIGSFIQQKRKEKNLTQKQLAEKIGLTDRAISKWERGQGCPDVSILEILSNELGCSVLELLKGREIENEVIPITEADDYVKGSMQISSEIAKNKIISMINKIIVTSIIFTVLLLTYLNINQLIYISRKNTMKIDLADSKYIEEKEEIIEKNLKIISNNQGKFSKDDHSFIYTRLITMFDSLKNRKLYKYVRTKEDIVYTVNDIIILSEGEIRYSEINLTNTLKEYVDNDMIAHYQEMVINNWTASLLYVNNLSTYTSYQYRLYYGDDNYIYNSGNDDIKSLIYNMKSEISRLAYLTEVVMEVGEIHE